MFCGNLSNPRYQTLLRVVQGAPKSLISVMTDLISDKDYVKNHVSRPGEVAKHCMSMLDEKEHNDAAYILDDLTPEETSQLLENWQTTHPLLYGYYTPRIKWTPAVTVEIAKQLKANVPAALKQSLKIKLANQSDTLEFAVNMNLAGTDFKSAKYPSTHFCKTNLRHCNFDDANLDRCNFSGADLSYANYRNASLLNIVIDKHTNLYGACFILSLVDDNFKHAIINYVLNLELPAKHLCFNELAQIKKLLTHASTDDNLVCECIALVWFIGSENTDELEKRKQEYQSLMQPQPEPTIRLYMT